MKATTCIAILCDILSWRTEHKQFQDTVCDDKIDLSPQAPKPQPQPKPKPKMESQLGD